MEADITIYRRSHDEGKARKCWSLQDGRLGTVEELAREYYLAERGYTYGVVDSSCLYGGIYWVVFHDIVFHQNLASSQPLRADFYHQGRLGYERYRDRIEQRLAQFRVKRIGVFEEYFGPFTANPLFTDPSSKIKRWSGSWVKHHADEVRVFLATVPEHDIEALLRETIISTRKGLNPGWPDLVVWNEKSLLFAEIKSEDEVSETQERWIQAHRPQYKVEVLRVCNDNDCRIKGDIQSDLKPKEAGNVRTTH